MVILKIKLVKKRSYVLIIYYKLFKITKINYLIINMNYNSIINLILVKLDKTLIFNNKFFFLNIIYLLKMIDDF